jgi:hypothetical protein
MFPSVSGMIATLDADDVALPKLARRRKAQSGTEHLAVLSESEVFF